VDLARLGWQPMLFAAVRIAAKAIPVSGGPVPPSRRVRYFDDAALCWEPQTLLQFHSKRRRTFKKTQRDDVQSVCCANHYKPRSLWSQTKPNQTKARFLVTLLPLTQSRLLRCMRQFIAYVLSYNSQWMIGSHCSSVEWKAQAVAEFAAYGETSTSSWFRLSTLIRFRFV